jgi:hypothetical protein
MRAKFGAGSSMGCRRGGGKGGCERKGGEILGVAMALAPTF